MVHVRPRASRARETPGDNYRAMAYSAAMDAFVYILGSDGRGKGEKGGPRTYVGWTNDLDARLAAHNSGKGAKSTRGRTWTLLYAERFKTRGEAMSREWHLKRDRKMRRAVLEGLDRRVLRGDLFSLRAGTRLCLAPVICYSEQDEESPGFFVQL